MKDFGIFIATHSGDFFLAKILIQSIRHYYKNVPITLIKDGVFDTTQVKQLGNINEFDNSSLPEPIKNLSGYYQKIKVLFNQQYEHFLYLDADTLLIGQILNLDYQKYDFYVCATYDDLANPETRRRVSRLIFDVEKLSDFDPDFSWSNFISFNSGHFFGKSGVFSTDLVLDCLQHTSSQEKNDHIFKFFDQGIFNYLFNKGQQKGQCTLGGHHFAITPSWEPPEKFPNLTLEMILSGRYKNRHLIHYTTPSRTHLLRNYPYNFALLEFYKQYYKNFSMEVRIKDEVNRVPVWMNKLFRHYVRQILKVLGLR